MNLGSRGRVGIVALSVCLLAAPAAGAATIKVTTTGDPTGMGDCVTTDHACSLRQAVNEAPGGATVSLAAGTYKLTQSALLTVANSITIAGAGARTTVIRQTKSGFNVLNINSGLTVTIQGVTVTGGHYASPGGGIDSAGTLTLKNSAVTGNESDGIPLPFPGFGGGIDSTGPSLTIIRSTISGNSAQSGVGDGGVGGGIAATGSVTVTNSTIAGNSAQGGSNQAKGGGIYVESTGSPPVPRLTLSNSTVAFNGDSGMPAQGGDVMLDQFNGTVTGTAKNSIIAHGTADSGSENCFGASGKLTSKGFNLEDRNQCEFTGTGDRHSIAAKLGALKNNGGATNTLALLSGSPAINRGNPGGCKDSFSAPITTDQRGVHRPQGARCDIGAFEFRVVTLGGMPRISGSPQVGQRLTCLLPAVQSPDGPATSAVAWLRNGVVIASGVTHLVTESDRGHSLSCRVVASNSAGMAAATSSAVPVSARPTVTITLIDINGHNATFKFTTHDATGAQCALSKGHATPRFSSCTSPKRYSSLASGSYTFSVRAVGPGGRSLPAKHSFEVS